LKEIRLLNLLNTCWEIDYSASIDTSYKHRAASGFEISENYEKRRKQSCSVITKWRHNGNFFLRISVKVPSQATPKKTYCKNGEKWNTLSFSLFFINIVLYCESPTSLEILPLPEFQKLN